MLDAVRGGVGRFGLGILLYGRRRVRLQCRGRLLNPLVLFFGIDMFNSNRLCAFFIAVVSVCSVGAAEDNRALSAFDDRSVSREASGLLQGMLANSQALNTYEACVDVWESALLPNDVVQQSRTISVVGFDLPKERYYRLMYTERREGERTQGCVSAVTLSDGKSRYLQCDGRVAAADAHEMDFAKAWRYFDTMDLRLVGHCAHPWDRRTLDRYDRVYQPARKFSLRPRGSTVTVNALERLFDTTYASQWDIDLESLTPANYIRKRLDEDAGKWVVAIREDYTWTDNDGVQVPIHVLGSKVKPATDQSGKRIDYEQDYDVTINWYHVNDEIVEEKFDFARVGNPQAIIEAIDKAKGKFKLER